MSKKQPAGTPVVTVVEPEVAKPFCTLGQDELLTIKQHRDLVNLHERTLDALRLAQASYWKSLREKHGFSGVVDLNLETGALFLKENG